MSIALSLAEKGRGSTSPNPVVGAVLVKDGRIVGRGWHRVAGGPHAEVFALRAAGRDARGATLYVNLEPCCTQGRTPPCTTAIINAGVAKVVYGISDPNPLHSGRADKILHAAGVEVEHPLLENECRAINETFFKWIGSGIPFVTLKLALTLDAKIADFKGVSKWITSEETRRRVQRLRLASDAILIGAETLRHDHPSLTVRDFKAWRQPIRIVASSSLSPESAEKLFSAEMIGGDIRIVNARTKKQWLASLRKLGAEGITSILVEGGAKIAAELLDLDLVDKIELHYAPLVLGLGARDALPVKKRILSKALRMKNASFAASGPDMIFTAYCK